ncbi:MAG: RNA polymerase sigma factor [Bacteroidales bacterium]|nr:RNA polymerase sigma factor [Bacteroidales bacterium]
MQEIQLIKALQNGDENAFKALVKMYRPMVHRVVFRMVQNNDDTEDLVQDVFIQIWQSICNFRGEAGLKTWIYRMAVNKAINHLRWKRIRNFMSISGNSSKINTEDRLQINDESGFEKLVQMDSHNTILWAMEKLPANQSAAFMLSKAEGLSNPEIAEVLNTTIGAVESLIFRAKKQLKKSLEKHYDEIIS